MDGNQNIVARYEYDPFGRLIGKWGTMADVNRYRFSSQAFFPNAGLYGYYGRFYDPTLQRWLNRDPFGEAGGLNLYGFVGNNPVGNVDPYGLAVGDWWDWRSYSTTYANLQGQNAVQAQLERAGYQSMNEFNLAHRTFQGTFTSGDMSAVQAGAGVAGTGAFLYVNGVPMIAQGGIIVKGEEAAAQGIADAAEQGWLSKLWNKCKFWKKNPPPGQTVLGHYPAYTELAEQLGANHFSIPSDVWNQMTEAEQWAANQQFLDQMIARGDQVILATPLDQVRPGSFFERELQYLQSKGFTPSADGTRMIPPGGH
jgi:RHS repeat-associated protein